jgi:hypothetical protein
VIALVVYYGSFITNRVLLYIYYSGWLPNKTINRANNLKNNCKMFGHVLSIAGEKI